ncbi:MAG: carbohydrate ABC transporter permease [Ruminococcaceae bacterium]|nr:carbohydrate ABC transporter permease [Oscillospiraceae bacterium]
MKKLSTGMKVFTIFNTLFMLFMIFICLYPMLYVLMASLSDSNKLMAHAGILLKPVGFNLKSYAAVLKNRLIFSGYRNTIFILVVGVAVSVFMTSLGAYFLSRRNVMLKGFVMGMITVTMFFSGGMIPLFLTVKNLGLLNSLWSLIIPSAINTFNLIILRTSFSTIPTEMEEAAQIDGTGHVRLLFQIILPISKSIIAVMILYYGVAYWNGWFNAAIYLNEKKLYPLQLVLREILLANDTSAMTQGMGFSDGVSIAETVKYAVIVVSTLPILCIYPFMQKYFDKGVMIGALKG